MNMPDNRLGRLASTVGILALVLWIGSDILGRIVKGNMPFSDRFVDYRIIYDSTRIIIATGEYPASFPYPPTSVILFSPLTSAPFPLSAGLFLFLLGTAGLACWLTIASLLRFNGNRGDYLILPFAHITCAYFFQWDLRSTNCNLLYLLLLLLAVRSLHRQAGAISGFWLALSISFKLYSLPLLAYFVWRGERRAAASCVGWLAFLWIVLPTFVFGPSRVISVYESWLGNLKRATTEIDIHHHPILISLELAGATLAGDWGQTALPWAGKIVWGVIFVFGWRVAAKRVFRKDDAFGLLVDVSIFSLAVVAVSPYLEPYPAVPFAIPAALLAWTIADSQQSRRLRFVAFLVFVATWFVMRIPIDWYAKGLLVNVKLALGVVGVIWISSVRKPHVSDSSKPIEIERKGRLARFESFSFSKVLKLFRSNNS